MKFSCVKENLERALSTAERFTGKNITLPILSNVLLEVKGNELTVTGTNLEYAVELKVPGKGLKEGRVSVPAKILNSLLQSLNEEKVELEEKGNNLFIHTVLRNTRINGMSAEDFPLILPQRVALELSRIISDQEEVEVTVGDSQVLFGIGSTKVTSRLIDG